MTFEDVQPPVIDLTEDARNFRRKAEFLRKFAVGKSLQRSDQTGAYTPTLLDLGRHLGFNSASDQNWTLENDFPAGAWFIVTQLGAGRVTFVAGTGATVNSRVANDRTLDQYSQVRADVISNTTGTNASWVISGNVG